MAIPSSFVQELIARADVVEVVGRHVQLKKAGANWMGLCPFHGEKSPSFTVSPTKQFYHCFGCGKSGNAIGFLMDHLGQGFVETVKDLAGGLGMPVPQDDSSPQDREKAVAQRAQHVGLAEMMAKAAEAYQLALRGNERGRAYLEKRGVSAEVAKTYGLGYSPEGWRNLASVFADYQDPKLVECGMVIERRDEESGETKRYDRFRDRVMFPIRNVKGETIGFGGRILDQGEPKYLNSPETPLFSKGRELYGLWEGRDAIRRADKVLVTEGYMDVVALAQHGFGHAVATLGTACTPEHVHKLFRFTDHVVFGFDGDNAGRRAARKALDGALPYASDTRTVKFLFLPKEHDPDSFIREKGAEAFGHAVNQATPLSRFLIDACREGCDMDTPEGRAQMLSSAQPLWRLLPDGTLRLQLLNELANLAALSPASLKDAWGLNAQPQLKRYQEYSNKFNKSGDQGGKYRKKSDGGRPDGHTAPQASGSGVTRSSQPSRADLLARMALHEHRLLGDLSGDQLATLGAIGGVHGELFGWLEGQLHDLGPQPWAALREGLREHPAEGLAVRLMRDELLAPASEAHQDDAKAAQTAKDIEAARPNEFGDLLRRVMIDELKVRESQAIEKVASDPDALARYKSLMEQRRALEKIQAAQVLLQR